jgi:hypothetical protein
MSKMNRAVSGAYAGGAIGALVNSACIWGLGKTGISANLGFGLKPAFTLSWLYPRLVWGGIFGLLLMLPMLKKRLLLRGMLVSLVPSALILFYVFPEAGKGMLGLGYGYWTPALIILLNFVWGMVASLWHSSVR